MNLFIEHRTSYTSREKEQLLMLESMEIQRMRDDYKKKVHQIEFDFFVAMTPLLELGDKSRTRSDRGEYRQAGTS